MRKIILSASLLIYSLITTAQKEVALVGVNNAINPYHFTTLKSEQFSKASVACAHPLASMAGVAMMKAGGNAFDAAITTQLVLAVVYPAAGNIGGGGFLVARSSDGSSITIDYRETAPELASSNMYLDKNNNVQYNLSQQGHLASGVPGSIAGLFAMLPYAQLNFKTLIQPAIDLAEFGFTISDREAASLNATQEFFIKNSSRPSAFIKNTKWKAGDTLIQKELASTLKRIRDDGQKGFYEGTTAQLIIDEMKRANGIITLKDLKNYTAKIRTPLSFNYKNYTIIGMPPPSSGGIMICQLMKMIAEKPLNLYGFQSTKTVQLMVEAERRAFADRATHLGDPDFWKVPISTLTSDHYIANRMLDYDSTKATPSKNIGPGMIKESEQTTHTSIIDKEGNMVAITTTLNGSYGCKTVVGGAGFLLNNEMDDFSAKPGTPNMYGAIGGEANKIEPGKRMLSSMTPTLVLKDNQPFIVCGTPGGTTIPTSVFQSLVNIIEFNMSATDAVNKPKFHHQWLPDEIVVEKSFPVEIRNQLANMGYKITERNAIGRTEIIKVLPNGMLDVAADSRGDDAVAGY